MVRGQRIKILFFGDVLTSLVGYQPLIQKKSLEMNAGFWGVSNCYVFLRVAACWIPQSEYHEDPFLGSIGVAQTVWDV